MKKNLSILLITIFFSANCQDLYFPSKENWEVKSPSYFNYDSKKIQKAIDFVIENQNKGDKDLRVEILKGFSTEPYHSIKGPTKKRGETNGLIIKDGYIIASLYTFRLIEDLNKNDIWDTGNYLKKIKPEPVYYFPSELEVRSNWDLNETFDLNIKPSINDSIK